MLEHLWETILSGALLAVSWFAKTIYNDVKETKESLSGHKLHVAENYVPKQDMKELKAEIIERFDRFEKKFDRLMDDLPH